MCVDDDDDDDVGRRSEISFGGACSCRGVGGRCSEVQDTAQTGLFSL